MDTWSNCRGPYFQRLTHFFGYDVPKCMLLEQAHAYMNTYLCFSHKMFGIKNIVIIKSMLSSDLDIFE